MKMRWVFLFLALACFPGMHAQNGPAKAKGNAGPKANCSVPSDEVAIRQIADQWKDGYNSGQAAKVASLYTEDAYYLTQHFITGIVYGQAAIQAYVQRGVDAKYRIDSIQTIALQCSGDFAYSIARYESTNGNQKVFGVNVVVLNKISGKWMIVAHESAVPDPATAIQHLDVLEQK
jgi:uncharacterized protein (TIGR02246 family)